MQRLKLFIPLVIFIVLAVFFIRGLELDPNAMPSALIDREVPKFSLPTLEKEDELVDESVMKGQVALLNVWATWCVTCRVEHAFLNQLAKKGVAIFGVNYKDDTDKAKRWLKDLHNPYVLSVIDKDGRFGLDLGVFGAPETYLIDKEGVIRYKHVGAMDERVWRETFEPLYLSLQ